MNFNTNGDAFRASFFVAALPAGCLQLLLCQIHNSSRNEKRTPATIAEVPLLNYSDFVEQFDLVFALSALM